MKKLVLILALFSCFAAYPQTGDITPNDIKMRGVFYQFKGSSLDSLIVPQLDGTAKYKNGADPVFDLDLANKRYVDAAGGWDSIVFNPNTGYASWYLSGVKLDSTFWDGRYVKYSDSTVVFVTPPQLSDSLATIQESPFDSILLVGADILTTDPAPYTGQTWYGLDIQRALASDGVNWFFVKLKSINSGFGGFGNPADNVTNNTTQIVIPDDGLFIFATTNGVGSGVKFSIISAAGETILITDPRITAFTGGIGVGDIIRINCHYDQSLGYQFTDDKLNVDVSGKIHMFDIAVGDLGTGVQFIDQSSIMFPFVIQSTQEDRHNLYSTQTEGLSVLLASVASGDYTLEIPTYIVKQEGINFQAYFNSNRQTVTRETTTEKQTVLVVYPDGSVANIAGQTVIDGNVYWNNLTESLTAVANNSWSTQLVYVDKFYAPFSGGVTNGIVYVIPWQADGTNQGYGDLNSAINDLQSYIDRHTPVENAALSYYVIIKKNTSSALEVVIGSLIGGGQGGGSSITTSLDEIINGTSTVSWKAGATNIEVNGSGTTAPRSLTFQDQDGIAPLQAIDPLTSGGVIFADGVGKLNEDAANLFWDDLNDFLGIGTNTPSTELDVLGKGTFNAIDLPLFNNEGILFYDALNDQVSQDDGLIFNQTNERLEVTSLTNDQLHLIYSPAFYTSFFTNGAGNLEIFPTGGVIFSDGELSPKTTLGHDLGSTLFRWNDLYVNNIDVSGTVDGRDIALDGTNQDNHIADATIHFTESSINTDNITEGTINEFSKWEETGSNIYYNIGNVGIGTSSIFDKLHVLGSDASLPITLKVQNTSGINSCSELLLSTSATASSTTVGASVFADRTDVGGGGSTDLLLKNSLATTLNTNMIIKADGDVGIGTINPAEKLEVVGNGLFTGDIAINGGDITSSGGTTTIGNDLIITGNLRTYGTGNNLLSNYNFVPSYQLDVSSESSISTGTNNPQARFFGGSVFSSDYRSGHIMIGRTAAANGNIHFNNGDGRFYIDNSFNNNIGDIAFRTKTSGTPVEALTIQGDGNVGIGTTSPVEKLEVNGKTKTSNFQMTNGAVDQYFLQTDGSGNASWAAISTSQVYKGTWDASTNTPTLSDGVGTAGWFYRVVVAGTQNLGSGNITFAVGDDVSYNGTIWEKIPGAGYTLQAATPTVLGGVKIGNSVEMNGSDQVNIKDGDKGDITASSSGTIWTIDSVSASKIGNKSVTNTEFGYLVTLTDTIQKQLDNKLETNETITLSGDATGTGSTSITVAVIDDSHDHTGATVYGLSNANFTDFDGDVAATPAVAANTAKVSNATHTGDVTGSTVLSIGADKVNDTHIDFGTGTNQVSTADIPEQTNLYYTESRVSANTSVTANTAKVTNATHTGEVTGSGALTAQPSMISNKTLKSSLAGTEEVLIEDGGLKKTTTQDIADLITNVDTIGINTLTPVSNLDVNGSLSLPFRTATSSTTITGADYTVLFTNSTPSGQTVTIPSASSSNVGRIYVIVNNSSNSITTSQLYTTITGAAVGSIPGNTAIRIQSNGNLIWFEIR